MQGKFYSYANLYIFFGSPSTINNNEACKLAEYEQQQ